MKTSNETPADSAASLTRDLSERLARRRNKVVCVADVLPDVMAPLRRLEAKAKQHRIALEKFVLNKPKRIACPNGSGESHLLDLDQSSRASWPDEHFQLVYAPCSACQSAAQSEWLQRVGVPKILLQASLDNWRARSDWDHKALGLVRDYAARGEGFLVLVGSVGLGKTHLAIGVMRIRKRGRILTQNRFLLKLRERYQNHEAEDIIEKCKSARLLVLDECGFMTGARDELPALYEVIDYRHGQRLPTILTTNVPVERFADAFGDRIADRLRCHQPFVVLSGESWRGATEP